MCMRKLYYTAAFYMLPMFDFCRECFVVAICKFFVIDLSDWQFTHLNQMAVLHELSDKSTLFTHLGQY